MQKFYEILPEQLNTSVALGFFDGMHIGHRKVIMSAVKQKQSALVPVCFTFSQSPKSVLKGGDCPSVMTDEDKEKALEALGIEHAYFADFKALMNLSPEEFVSEILSKKLKAKKVFCGFNYRFGKNGAGDARELKTLCKAQGIEAEIIPPETLRNQLVSSTLIRSLISEGEIEKANEMLGSRFGFCSVIEHGKQLGRLLGTPTINQPLVKGLVVPKFGVYASSVTLENGRRYCGVTNIGVKPTVGGKIPLSETWLPEYEGEEIYGQRADIRLLSFIRPEKKFGGIDELKSAIEENGETAKKIFYEQG